MDYSGAADGYRVDRPQWSTPTDAPDTEFKRKYPPEGLGDEMLGNARVWKVYSDEAATHDTIMLDGWSKTVDVLLIFAGLFSAVVTAFLVESYKLSKPDNSAAYMSTALSLLVSGSDASSDSLPAPPPINSLVTPLTRWTNGLWFTSLLLSLGVALLCILVKQWIGEYTARNGASAADPRHWAVRRQLYYQALRDWPVSELVSVLPALLRLSLFLFSAGIVGFLWDLDRALGIWVFTLSASLGIFYAGCTLLPLWIPECPTSTPLVSILRRTLGRVRVVEVKSCIIIQSRLLPWLQPFLQAWRREQIPATPTSLDGILIDRQPTAGSSVQNEGSIRQTREPEKLTSGVDARLHSAWEQLEADALLWLIFSVSHHDAVAVGLQAIGGLREECPTLDRLRADDRFADYNWKSAYLSGSANQPLEDVRIVRSMLRIERPFALLPKLPLPEFSKEFYALIIRMADSEHLDSRFLWWFYQRYIVGMKYPTRALDSCYSQSVSVTSTIMSAIYVVDLDIHDLLEAMARCDIRALSSSALTFLLDRIYASVGGSLIRCRDAPPSIALLEMLCQVTLMPSMNKSTLQHLVAALTESAFIRRDWSSSQWALFDFPFLTQYLGSRLWIESKYQQEPECLRGILRKIVDEARLYYRVPVVLRRQIHALTATLFMAQRAGYGYNSTLAIDCCLELLDCYIEWSEFTWDMPSDLVQAILQPMSPAGLSLSLWDILRGTGLDYYMTPELAEKLSRALCFIDDGVSTAETELFLSSLPLRDLLEMWHSSVNDPEWESYGSTINCRDRYLIFHTIQHCADLRPMWWFDGRRLVHEGGSDDFEQSIHELEKLVSQQWVLCTTCPAASSDTYEWDPPSTCGFNPAGQSSLPVSTDSLMSMTEGRSSSQRPALVQSQTAVGVS